MLTEKEIYEYLGILEVGIIKQTVIKNNSGELENNSKKTI